jgi:hypothetical protein
MWYIIQDKYIEVQVVVKPNAKRTVLQSITEQALQISLHAKPHQGEANKELLAYLAELFHVPKSYIELKRGDKSRHKSVLLPCNPTVQKIIEGLIRDYPIVAPHK